MNVDGSKEVQYFQFRETLKFKNSKTLKLDFYLSSLFKSRFYKTCVGIYFCMTVPWGRCCIFPGLSF